MSVRTRSASKVPALVLALGLAAMPADARQTTQGPAAQPGAAQAAGTGAQVMLDRVAAIVNGDLILESDVDAEQRFAAFQPFTEPQPVSRDQVMERLIDRTLIQQQMALQPEPPISDADADAELATLRKAIPGCTAYHCQTESGWEKFVADQGFSVEELRERWRVRMEVLRFIEQRFRMGIRIEQAQIDDYYKNTMLPVYQKDGVTPPTEATIADRIQEILLQEQVNKLMDDWLTSLRAQGSVRILKPGEEAP
jgi:hypothetical protein